MRKMKRNKMIMSPWTMKDEVSIVGVLNVTPDSFHDGGKFLSADEAIEWGLSLFRDGADIVEIGGESSLDTAPVSLEEELRRILPVIRGILKAKPDARLSVDTYKADTAKTALYEGVSMINDVTAGRADPSLFDVVAKAGSMLVLMHSKDPSARTTIRSEIYDDVVSHICEFLRARKDEAIKAGVAEGKIILDPGLGHFLSSEAKYSHEVLARLPEFLPLGCPLMISPSRKSFLAGSEKLPTADRLPGTIAASAIAVLHGATCIRTHDVLEVRRGCEIASMLRPLMRRPPTR